MYAASSPAQVNLEESSGKTEPKFNLFGILVLWGFFLSHLISTDAANLPLAALLKIPVSSYF